MTKPVAFKRSTARKLLKLLDAPMGAHATPKGLTRRPTADTYYVKVTSLTTVGGRYPGTRYNYDALTATFTAVDTIWVVDMNGVTPSLGVFYTGTRGGQAGTPAYTVWVTEIASGGGTTSPLTTKGDLWGFSSIDARVPIGTDGYALVADSTQTLGLKWATVSGTGTVTTVSVASANGVSGSVATATTTPAITLTLGAITPTTVNGLTITTTSGTLTLSSAKTLDVFNTLSLKGVDGSILTLGGSLTTSGAFASTFTMTAATSVTFPTSGTLATTAQIPLAANPAGAVGLAVVNGSATTFLRSDGAPALNQSITPSWRGLHKFTPTMSANTEADAVALSNSNTAAAASQQYSPAVHFTGNGWETNTGASQAVDFRAYVVPTQGVLNPTAHLIIESSINGAAFGSAFCFSSLGGFSTSTTEAAAGIIDATNGFTLGAGAPAVGHYLRGNGTAFVNGSIAAADVPTLNQSTTGSAATLTTGRTIAMTGDLAWTSPSFNGSGNVTAAGTLATVNGNVGTFVFPAKITVNAKGLVTAVSVVATGTLTDASSIAWDLSASPVARVTLAGNHTLANPTNLTDGGTYVLEVTAAGHTLSYGTVYKWPGGTAPTVSGTSILTFWSDGTNMYGVGQEAFA